jgi:cytochrome c oxidase cbb3-type subunit 3
VAAYARSLSGGTAEPDAAAAGASLFADNCASCHGAAGTGDTEVGAPDLTDSFWIYGGDEASLFKTVMDGRQGWMPSWEDRLTVTDRKILAAYLLELGQGGMR